MPRWFPPRWKKPSGDIPGRKSCQWGSPVTGLASPAIFKFQYIIVFLLFPGVKWSKLFPGENFKVHRGTWPGCLNCFKNHLHLADFTSGKKTLLYIVRGPKKLWEKNKRAITSAYPLPEPPPGASDVTKGMEGVGVSHRPPLLETSVNLVGILTKCLPYRRNFDKRKLSSSEFSEDYAYIHWNFVKVYWPHCL